MGIEFTQRFRRDVTPYNLVQSLAPLAGSGYCPAMQTIGTDGLPGIDRTSVPTVLQAVVSATAADQSGSVASVASDSVTNVKWMVQGGNEVQGTDITLHPAWAGKFTIGTGAQKGRLEITYNIPAGTTWKVWMECVINDSRRGYVVAVPVVTDSVLLYSIVDGAEQYTMSIDRPSGEIYEPARDQRLIHEYLTGLGKTHVLTDDGNTYLRTVTAVLRKGGARVPDADYSVKVFRVAPSGTRTEVTPATDECVSAVSGGAVTFDLRFSESATFQIACYAGSTEVAHKTYGWAWSGEMPSTNEGLVGGSTYCDGDVQTYRPKLNFGKGLLENPLVAFKMQWGSRNLSTGTSTYAGAGEQHTFDIAAISKLNGLSEVALAMEKRGTFAFVTDADGNRYVDGNGNYYVEN